MVELTEMKRSLGVGLDRRIFVGLGPALYDGHHDDRHAARLQATMKFAERLGVVDMFKDVRCDEDIHAFVFEVEFFEIERQVAPAHEEIGRLILARMRPNQIADCRFRREVDDPALHETVPLLEHEREKPMAL